MAYQGQQKVQKVMVQPINLIFRYLQGKTRVSVWLFENVNTRMEGVITGFDEYMNLVNINIECDVISGAPLKKGTGGPVIRLNRFEINSTFLEIAIFFVKPILIPKIPKNHFHFRFRIRPRPRPELTFGFLEMSFHYLIKLGIII